MIYIKNSTEIQKIYIPKNDGMPCSSSHKGSGYDEGYHDGYVDAEQDIIATFTSATITENGEYGSSAHPYSSVTVDVDLDAPYESGYTDGYASGWSSGYSSGYSSGFSSGETTGYDEGYDSGYTSGMSSGYSKGWSEGFPEGQQDIINTFTSETLTVNGIYGSSAHPYSSVTVDVDMDAPYESGYTDGYESGYTSGYSSGYTSGETAGYDSGYSEGYESGYSSGSDVGYQEGYESGYTSGETAGYESGFTSGETVGYESGVTDGYSSGYTSGETVGFNSGYTSGVTDGEQNIIDTFTAMTANTNGVYGSSAQPLSSVTVDVPTGKTSVLTAGTFTENGTYEPSVVTLLDYIETDGYDILFDTGVKMTSTGETVVLDFMPLTGTIHYDAYLCYMAQQENDNSDTWQLGFRQATAFANNPSGGYWYTNGGVTNMSVYGQISADTRAYVEISNTGITINGVSSAFNITTVVNTDCNIVLNGQYASNANYRCPYARYYGFKLLSGATLEADLRPALDGDIPCFYDMVNERFIYQIGTGHTTAGNVIGTSAVTNFDGWSSVTVNVPTGETYNIEEEKLFTATTNGNYTIVPSTATTVVDEYYNSDTERYYITATTSNYPSTGYFELIRIDDEFDDSKGYVDIYFDDGRIGYDDSLWYGGEVYEWSWGTTNNEIQLHIKNANRYFGWTRLADFSGVSYDLMSSVTLTVDVDTASTYNQGYQSGVTDGEQNIIGTFTADTATTNGTYGSSANPLSSITVNVDQSGSYQSGYTDGYTSGHSAGVQEGRVDIYNTFTSMTVNTNGTYGSFWHPLSSITVSVSAHSSTTEYDYNSIYAKYNFSSSGSNPILSHTYYVQEMYVDGSSASEVPSTTRNFSAGEHSIAFVGNNPNILNKYCFYMSGTELTELVVGKAFDKFSDSYGGALTNCTKLSAITLLYDGVVSISSGEVATFANNGVMYVPASLMTAYVQSPYWSQLFTNKGWTIEMIEDTQVAYNEGFDDGLGVGYESGASSVNLGQKTITANGTYHASDDGYDGYDMIEVDVPSSSGCTGSSEPVLTAWGVEYDTGIALDWGYSLSASHVTLRPDLSSNNYEYLFGDYNSSFGYYGLFRRFNYVIFKSTHMLSVKGLLYDSSFYISTAGTVINGETVDSGDHILPTENSIKLFSDSNGNCITTSGQTLGVVEIWDENQNLVGRFTPQPDGTFYDDVNDTTIYPTVLDQNNYGYSFEYYDSQYREGCKDGWDIGFDDGWGRGFDFGYQSGHTDGFSEGYQSGYTDGYNDGSQGGSSADTEALKGMIERIYMTGMTIPSGTSRIGWYAFYGCESLSSVTIPDSVTAIGSYAFTVCTGLTNITIPNNITSIPNGVFSGCTSLTSVTLGSGVTACTNYAFAGCSQLKTIYFRKNNPPTLGNQVPFPTGTAYATGGVMYVPSGSSATYSTWKNTNATAKRSFSGWTVTEYTLDE